MSLLKSAYKLIGITYLDKNERLVNKEDGKVRFKCTQCESGTTQSVMDNTPAEKIFRLYCNSCGSYGEYLFKGVTKPVGNFLTADVYNFYQTQSDGSLKFIGSVQQ